MTETSAIIAVAGLAAGYAITGLALQHAAYILQYGSVFTSFREWLGRTASDRAANRPLRWLCAQLRELVGCQLCSITQLALWFCALPVTAVALGVGGTRPLGLSPALGALAYLLLALGVMFSTAAAGMICWDLARLVGRGGDALVLYLRARKELAEADLRVRERTWTVVEPPAAQSAPVARAELRILRTAGSGSAQGGAGVGRLDVR